MSVENETKYERERRIIKEFEVKQKRQRELSNRINRIKRLTSKLSIIAIYILITILVYNFLVSPVNVNIASTAVTGEGDFDKIVINREQVGDSNVKILFVVIEELNKEFVSAPSIYSFYNRSIVFFITMYIDGLAQPSEHFVLRTEGTEVISCKNNITISFAFGVMNDVVVPFYEVNPVALAVIPIVGIVAFIGFIVFSNDVINERWRHKWY